VQARLSARQRSFHSNIVSACAASSFASLDERSSGSPAKAAAAAAAIAAATSASAAAAAETRAASAAAAAAAMARGADGGSPACSPGAAPGDLSVAVGDGNRVTRFPDDDPGTPSREQFAAGFEGLRQSLEGRPF